VPPLKLVEQAGTNAPILGVELGRDLALGALRGQQDLGERRWSRRRTTQDGVAAEQGHKTQEPALVFEIFQPEQLVGRLPAALGVKARLAVVGDDDPSRLRGLVRVVPPLLDGRQRATLGVLEKLRRTLQLDGRDDPAVALGEEPDRAVCRPARDHGLFGAKLPLSIPRSAEGGVAENVPEYVVQEFPCSDVSLASSSAPLRRCSSQTAMVF